MLSEDSKWRILKAVQRKEKVTEIARRMVCFLFVWLIICVAIMCEKGV